MALHPVKKKKKISPATQKDLVRVRKSQKAVNKASGGKASSDPSMKAKKKRDTAELKRVKKEGAQGNKVNFGDKSGRAQMFVKRKK